MNILDCLNKKELTLFVSKKLKKGHTLYKEDDLCKQIGIIKTGQISIVSYLSNGKEIIYNTLNKDMMFGNNLIFSTYNHYKGDVVANKDSEILLIDKNDLIHLLKTNDKFMNIYMQMQADFSKTLNDRIKLLAIDNAEDRFLFYLHSHCNIIEYITITQLAKELYLSRETLSRLLSKLSKENKIIKDKNTIRRK